MARKRLPPPSPALLFAAHFADLKDPRRHQHKVRYPLPLVLLIVFAAVLSGFDGWEAFAQFAAARRAWLRRLVPFDGDDTPAADTIREVIERLQTAAFARCFTAWAAALADAVAGRQIALDGKSVQGARDAGQPTVPLHLLHAWLVDQQLLLAAVPVAGAPGEPPAIPDVLALLELEGAVVTSDANGTSRPVADAIVDGGAVYLLALKGNRGPQHAAVDAFFAPRTAQLGTAGFAPDDAVTYACAGERGHGRAEFRQAWAVPAARVPAVVAWLPHARSLLCIERSRRGRDGAWSCETQYYVGSRLAPAAYLAGFVRRHWSVENDCHRTLDVVLHEDASRVRKASSATHLALIRRHAASVLRRDTTLRGSLPARMRQAALDDDYREHLLSLVLS
jgi:predicted transposase YbfD/YdcC